MSMHGQFGQKQKERDPGPTTLVHQSAANLKASNKSHLDGAKWHLSTVYYSQTL